MAAKFAVKNISGGTYYGAGNRTWSSDLGEAKLCSTLGRAKRLKTSALEHAKIVRHREGFNEYPGPDDEVEVVKVVVQEAPES